MRYRSVNTRGQGILSLVDALELLPQDILARFGDALGIDKKPQTKSSLINIIEKQIVEQLPELWKLLTEQDRLAIAEAIHFGEGRFNNRAFEAKYETLPEGLLKRVSVMRGDKPPYIRLFLYSTRHSYDVAHLIVPSELIDLLKPVLPALPPVVLRVAGSVPAEIEVERAIYPEDFEEGTPEYAEAYRLLSVESKCATEKQRVNVAVREREQAAQAELVAILQLIDAGKVTVSAKTQLPLSATFQQLATCLVDGDYYNVEGKQAQTGSSSQAVSAIKAFAWTVLLQCAELVTVAGDRLKLTPLGIRSLGEPASTTIALIWKHWLTNDDFDEFQRIEVIKGQREKKYSNLTDVRPRRATVVSGLRQCPVGEWVSFNDFSFFVRASGLPFELCTSAWQLYTGNPHDGSLRQQDSVVWNILQDRYMLACLFEYIATLGLIDIAYCEPAWVRRDYNCLYGTQYSRFLSRYDGLLYFRVNPLGSFILGLAAEYTPTAKTSTLKIGLLTALSSLQIKAHADLSTETHAVIETFADREAPNCWRLNRQKAVAAINRGHSIERLRGLLQAGDDQSLPETVEAFILNAQKYAVALKPQGKILLFECMDADTARAIAGHKLTKQLCMLAGDKHVVVPDRSRRQFDAAVQALGYGIARLNDD